MTPRLLGLALALFTTSVMAQGYDRSDLVRGLCDPSGCDEFKILATEKMLADDEGALFRTRIKTFRASYAGRTDVGEENGYVYCSRAKPAIMAEQDGKTMAFMIAPFATQDSRETVRKNANFVSLYFTICHGAEAGKAAARDISAVAERLGYRVPLTKSNLVPLARAEDIMTAGQQVLPEPRREKRLETATQQRTEAGEVILRREPPRHVPLPLVEEDDITSAPRRLANRALDALDEVGNWVFGRGR